ncbi:pilus assembly protein TadG-related protein [Silicimonas sp. MF1-12-2]|uniref:pilus assembly protein TadG-related protein n=1 Tax=Silicimonas sp. MF1-12-2 TaxID=3384793 RepID=UPI0039B465C2
MAPTLFASSAFGKKSPVQRRDFARTEDGSLTIFSLFMFILILMVTGLAVDMARHENERVRLQNTLDTAVLAAGSLESGAETEAEMEAMVLDYIAKAGIDPSMVTVDPEITGAYSRKVTASADFQLDTLFMGLMGINSLPGVAAGQAAEGQEKVEVVLVLDVSGSMGSNGKIEALRPAAKGFVTEMINRLGAERVAISVVPYNHQVHVDDELRARLNWDNTLTTVESPRLHPGAITTYNTHNASTRCARFRDDDFRTAALAAGGAIEGSAMFSGLSGRNLTRYAQYPSRASWCSDEYKTVLLYQNDERDLHDFIDTLEGSGWTSIDYGMNWGVGLLENSFAPIVQDMVDDNLLSSDMAGHPFAFGDPDVKKVVVLMTDGMNTDHLDLADAFKSGPSRVWYSETQANGNEFNGFIVEMPDEASNRRWYVPGSPGTNNDDTYLAEGALPADAVQWDYHEVYERFRPEDVPNMYFRPDQAAYNAHANARIDTGSYETADARVRNICGEARASGIEVYTIAFQAPSSSETLLSDCAGDASRYFDVDGLDIATAFEAIAVNLTKLRLTQ